MERYQLKTSFTNLTKNDPQGIRGPLISPTRFPSHYQPKLLES